MPDKRKHRGKNPKDITQFDKRSWEKLVNAVQDLSYLFQKNYSQHASLKLVGDRYQLSSRQRMAVLRSSCSQSALDSRFKKLMPPEALKKHSVAIDGFNLLITIESLLSGGIILKGRDGLYRDLASVHGSYRNVFETLPAVNLIGKYLSELHCREVVWFLDSPVSNSGKLKTILLEEAIKNNWNWKVRPVKNPDYFLKRFPGIIISSDSDILDKADKLFNLTERIISDKVMEGFHMSILDFN